MRLWVPLFLRRPSLAGGLLLVVLSSAALRSSSAMRSRRVAFSRSSAAFSRTSAVAILDHAIAFHEAQPPLRTGKRGRKKSRIGHNLALRLRKHKEGCLRFLTDPRTPFTNNEAERDLRMAKLRQKISGGFRSERGAYNFARMRAVIATARKQGWNVLQTLVHPDPMQLIPQLRL